MTDVESFLREAAQLAGVSVDRLLARILHVEDGAFASVVAEMEASTAALALRVDREIRVRNPGLHYVMRKMYVGYRREGAVSSPQGERSQIFASMIRSSSRLEIVLPVDPAGVTSIPNAQDLRGKGHHGIGDVRICLRTESDVDRFLGDFDHWLTPTALIGPQAL